MFSHDAVLQKARLFGRQLQVPGVSARSRLIALLQIRPKEWWRSRHHRIGFVHLAPARHRSHRVLIDSVSSLASPLLPLATAPMQQWFGCECVSVETDSLIPELSTRPLPI